MYTIEQQIQAAEELMMAARAKREADAWLTKRYTDYSDAVASQAKANDRWRDALAVVAAMRSEECERADGIRGPAAAPDPVRPKEA
jgi:hypothetical protein